MWSQSKCSWMMEIFFCTPATEAFGKQDTVSGLKPERWWKIEERIMQAYFPISTGLFTSLVTLDDVASASLNIMVCKTDEKPCNLLGL